LKYAMYECLRDDKKQFFTLCDLSDGL
jgi:hypothetical protein